MNLASKTAPGGVHAPIESSAHPAETGVQLRKRRTAVD
jgi:hypothetical protein